MKRLLYVAAVLALAVGCHEEPVDTQNLTENPKVDEQYTIAVVPKGLAHQFWKTVQAGAEAAGEEFGAEIIWNGPAQETDVSGQVNIINDLLNRQVDALVMAATNDEALAPVVERAVEKGTPVVTIDSGVKSDAPVTFVATDNVAGAEAAAHKLAELIGGEGEVVVIPFLRGAASSDLREEGFAKGIADYPNITVLPPKYSQSDPPTAMSVTKDLLTSHPNVKGIFAANEPGAIGAVQALKTSGKTGDIKVVAFDASPQEIAALEDGSLQALVVQNPFAMGYEGVKAAVDAIEGREVPKRIDTGVTVVTKDNLNDPEVQKLLNPKLEN